MLSNTEIDECFKQPSKSGFGKSRYDIAKEIIAAYENKLREQEPIAYINVNSQQLEWAKPTIFTTPRSIDLAPVPLYMRPNPAPITAEQIAEIKRKERERCAAMLENGRFLHDQAPTKLFATEAAKAIREMKKEMK